MTRIKRIALFPNNENNSNNIAEVLKRKLQAIGYVIDNQDYQLAIAIGGDGSFLRMVKNCQFKEEKYYIGINTGTLGFAQEIYPKNIDEFLTRLKVNDLKIESIGIEETKIKTESIEDQFYSLNEIVIREKNLKTAYLDIIIDDNYLETFVGDGISISTSFGSTAYNKNLGGSIVYSDLHIMQITPIAPINNEKYRVLKNSIVIPEDRKVRIIPTFRSKDFLISTDGENRIYDNPLEIETSVKRKIKLLRMRDYDYTKKINEKFL